MKKIMITWSFVLLAIVITVANVGKCSAWGNSIKILDINPNPATSLNSGSEVNFNVEVEYIIEEDSAIVNLIFQKGDYLDGVDSIIGSTIKVVSKGKGTLSLEKTIAVPVTNVLQVFTAIMIPGQTQTTAVDMKAYKVIISAPASASEASDLCRDYADAKENDKAIEVCTSVIGVSGYKQDAAYTNRGVAYLNKGQYEQANADFKKAIELNPNYEKAYINRGFVYLKKGQFNRAIAEYNKAIELNPKYDLIYIHRGWAYHNIRRYDNAIADYSKTLELNSKNAEAYSKRGLSYQEKKMFDLAFADYNKAIELNPILVEANYNLSCIYSLNNNVAEACKWLRKAIDVGYNDWDHIKRDSDLNNIRNASCYKELTAGR